MKGGPTGRRAPRPARQIQPAVVDAVGRAGRGLLILILLIEALALVVSQQLGVARYLDASIRDAIHAGELILVASFALIPFAALLAWRTGRRWLAVQLIRVYVVVITVEIVEDVVLLVLATQAQAPHSLWYLADLASVLALNISVFTIAYVILDVTTLDEVFIFLEFFII